MTELEAVNAPGIGEGSVTEFPAGILPWRVAYCIPLLLKITVVWKRALTVSKATAGDPRPKVGVWVYSTYTSNPFNSSV